MRRINVNLFPKEGYYFKEKDGATIRADSWPSVMRKVENYRKRNNYTLGNIEDEVSQQACARNPSYCTDINDATIIQRRMVSLKTRVLQWLGAVRRVLGRLTFVSAREAEQRANICASCPLNIPLPEGCASCRAALGAMRREILGRGRTIDGRLNGCLASGRDLPTDVHLDSDRIEIPDAPAFCWRKRGL